MLTLDQFSNFILQNNLCTKQDKLLLAVSGGADSMVLCDLVVKSGFTFGIAHCNFNLRGANSMGDETFVEKFAITQKFHYTAPALIPALMQLKINCPLKRQQEIYVINIFN
ncbi:MAG: hypothetical protein IPL12_00865 [Bacteroidetes bacterium]|nr:hypothetical protein [Bacteroidota bacterium]